jgi:hypothetical protein
LFEIVDSHKNKSLRLTRTSKQLKNITQKNRIAFSFNWFYPENVKMDEFEALWLNSLQIAKEKAKYTGNKALVEYLDLKIRNDRTRFEASKLLFKSFTQVAQEKIAGG